jgi:RNA recognition motif-containing protein
MEKPDRKEKKQKLLSEDLSERIVFVGGVPRKGRDQQDALAPMDTRIFSNWALRTFTGVVIAKLRVDLRNQSMGYGFVTFDSSENAKKAIQQGRAAFDGTYVEIKPTAKRNVDNRNNRSLIVTSTDDVRTPFLTGSDDLHTVHHQIAVR